MTRNSLARKSLRNLRYIVRTAERPADATPAWEWLRGNSYLVERECYSAALEIRGSRLDCICVERVLSTARQYLDSCGESADESGFAAFLFAAEPLRECELCLFIPVLRLAITERLAALCEQLVCGEETDDTAERFAALFNSLRFLATFDADETLESVNVVEQILRRDPQGVYAEMDEDSRRDYRADVAVLARRHRMDETAAAQRVLDLSELTGEHVGEYIYTRPLGKKPTVRSGKTYIIAIVFAALAASCAAARITGIQVFLPLTVLPFLEIAGRLADYIVSKTRSVRRLPRLALKDGIPDSAKTVAVVSVLLSKPENCVRAAALLEEYRLANRDAGSHLLFGLLADLPESGAETQPSDEPIIRAAGDAVTSLNEKYGGGFYLLLRPRTLRSVDGIWSGRERKRGAIEDLARLLSGSETQLRVVCGDSEALGVARYIITLDADTRLTAGSAKEMAGAMLHPLAQPVVSASSRVVSRGYAILQPRIVTELSDAVQSELTRVFCGGGGLDPYGGSSGGVYPALTGGLCSFVGKGIIDAQAYLRVLDGRFPENTVLSHDIIEGAFLRCGSLGDVELTDGHPSAPAPYYTRANRWIRGDWQNMRWISARSGMSAFDRWKIFDNMRRSLHPVAAAVCLIFAGFDARYLSAAVIAVLSLASGDLLRFLDALPRRRDRVRRYFSFVPDGAGTPLARCLARLLLLPADASVALRAIASALWRMFVSHKKLLEWTTAADAENKRGGLLACVKLAFPASLAALAVALYTPYPPAAALAIIWLLSPLYMRVLTARAACKTVKPAAPPELLVYAADTWRYFDTFLTEADHFLPPDNYQESPNGVLARRTSPTNIGLSLLSCLAAVDLGLTDRPRGFSLIESTLRSLDALEKWHGHPYNWYDTATLAVLPPRYVSTVDSGNLAACLAALREGLLELGQTETAHIADRLYRAMDFAKLYDVKKRLFHIGYDADSDEYSQSSYDLMASEAMQTSYLAVARGDVPRRHWRTLSRAQVGAGGYRGMASWTGTMFEYLMPYLLLPLPKHSLLYESARFCVFAQRRRTVRGVWGMSESAYGAITGGVYRYKAHGVSALALKRGMEADAVIAPYASFLALCLDTRAATANLRRLEKLGAYGTYGFCDAIDFTPGRAHGASVVRTYMAHHLGMSLVAADNILRDGIMRHRFTRDPDMRSYLELLRESVPRGGAVISSRNRRLADPPGRGDMRTKTEIREPDVFLPPCAALSDERGRWSIIISATGQNVSFCGEHTVTRNEFDAAARHCGVLFFLRLDDRLIPLQPAPFFETETVHTAKMGADRVTLITRSGDVRASVTARVSSDGCGELRDVEISSQKPLSGEVLCYFEPVLAPIADYMSHPAFSKLSLESRTSGNIMLVTRRPRGSESGLTLAVACSADAQYIASRETALGRCGFSSLSVRRNFAQADKPIAALDPCVLAEAPFQTDGKTAKVRFSIAAHADADNAATNAEKLLRWSGFPLPERQPDEFCAELLPYLLYRSPDRRLSTGSIDALSLGRNGLWSLGISGDFPVVACDLDACDDSAVPYALISSHCSLKQRGVDFDLVFLTDEGGDDYRAPRRESVTSALRDFGCEDALNCRAGVFVVQKTAAASELVVALASRFYPPDCAAPPPRKRQPEQRHRLMPDAQLDYGWNNDGSFWFETSRGLPPNAWSHVLANAGFGSLVTDAGTGHMWRGNARENKISQWLNDALTVSGSERAFAVVNGMRASLFSAPDGLPCRVTYGFGFAVWEKVFGDATVKTTVFVPPEHSARIMLIESTVPAEIDYCVDLELSDGFGKAQTVVTARAGNTIFARNPYNADFETSFALGTSLSQTAFTCSRASYLAGVFDGVTGAGFPACAAVKFVCDGAAVIAAGEPAAVADVCAVENARSLLCETRAHWDRVTGAVRLESRHEPLDRYVNGWAMYQSLACRYYARTSLYQCGGAYGFRDQLQDAGAILYAAPDLAREHILRCSSRQFAEGDVQHWWHPGAGTGSRGVRTRCSDDLLWLPETVCEYVKITGDAAVLDFVTPFLSSPPLTDAEHERYEDPGVSAESATVYEHCKRAIDLVICRGAGLHGLCLIGGGDWNDGMNLVGAQGRGESVWLTWFFARTARRFAGLARSRGDVGTAERFESAADERAAAANRAWDGEWFLRGWYDDGSPLGSAASPECRIDSIAQSFAVLGGGETDKTRRALESAYRILFDSDTRIVKLFDPPFADGGASPGYIKGYSPGFRENGGQYTHGAVWLGLSLLLADMRQEGWEVLSAILPSGRGVLRYRTEPYVLPADVYSNESHIGRGGWTWYTGASGWYLRAVVESLLGVDVREGSVTCEPRVPDGFGDFRLTLTFGGKTHVICCTDGVVTIESQEIL